MSASLFDNGGAAGQTPDQSAYAPAAPRVSFRISGQPQPGGSKRAFTPPGCSHPNIVDANPKTKDWKRTVQAFAQIAFSGPLIDGPMRVVCMFYLRRRKDHFRTNGSLKPKAPHFHTTKPDATKLWRSTEDALKGIVFTDDARISVQVVQKVYTDSGWTGAVIEIEELQEGVRACTET